MTDDMRQRADDMLAAFGAICNEHRNREVLLMADLAGARRKIAELEAKLAEYEKESKAAVNGAHLSEPMEIRPEQ